MADPSVAILMGSDSDLPTVREACNVLAQFGVPFEVRVLSAHRCPEDSVDYVARGGTTGHPGFSRRRGRGCPSGGSRGSPHDKAGARHPDPDQCAGGLDSLLSMVQMPGGVPVATMAIGNAGGAMPVCLPCRSWL